MKTLLATALLTAMTASSAMADVQFETRAFHSNLRLDAGRTTSEFGGETEDVDMSAAFLNTAGVGFAVTAPATETIDFGLGLGLARYHPNPGNELNQQVINGFTRIQLAQTEFAKFHMLAGVSRQQLTQHYEGNEFSRVRARYSPIVNSDLGLGVSFPISNGKLGFEYKYSNSIARGRGTLKSSFKIPGFLEGSGKTRIRDIAVETQELALTFGIKL